MKESQIVKQWEDEARSEGMAEILLLVLENRFKTVPDDLRAIVYGRHWMRNGIPFLKELIGLEGDQVCIFSDRLEVNGRTVGPVFRVDSVGFPLPQHPGCFVIPKGNFFAASQYLDKSFDGRYFGALPLNIVEGEAKPVWIF